MISALFASILMGEARLGGLGSNGPDEEDGRRRQRRQRPAARPSVVSMTCSSGRDALATTKQDVSRGDACVDKLAREVVLMTAWHVNGGGASQARRSPSS